MPAFRQTEIGSMHRVGGFWYIESDRPATNGDVFGHSKIPGLSNAIGKHSTRIISTLPLLMGVLMAKGYDLRINFKDPDTQIVSFGEDGGISMAQGNMIHGSLGATVTQAWSGAFAYKDRNGCTYAIQLNAIDSVEAYHSPLNLRHTSSSTSCKELREMSVAWMSFKVENDRLTFDYGTRILGLIHSLFTPENKLGFDDPYQTHRAGTDMDMRCRVHAGIDLFMVTGYDKALRLLHCMNLPFKLNHWPEGIVSELKHGTTFMVAPSSIQSECISFTPKDVFMTELVARAGYIPQ